jgi:hypothetical protein
MCEGTSDRTEEPRPVGTSGAPARPAAVVVVAQPTAAVLRECPD